MICLLPTNDQYHAFIHLGKFLLLALFFCYFCTFAEVWHLILFQHFSVWLIVLICNCRFGIQFFLLITHSYIDKMKKIWTIDTSWTLFLCDKIPILKPKDPHRPCNFFYIRTLLGQGSFRGSLI